MPEITKTETSKPVAGYVWLMLAATAIFVYFLGLNIPFVGPDEPRYAQVAREMLERGDWITPTLGGYSWFEKPPLLYWLEMVSYKLFGVSEFAARLGPALFGLGTIASLWILGRSVERSTKSDHRQTNGLANWLALVAASTLGIIVFSHGASFDIIITFPVTAALVSFFIFDQSKHASFGKRDLPLLLFYVFSGIALLAKGLIGIIFPLSIVGCFFLFSRRRPGRTFVLSLLWGTFVAITIASVWYLPMYWRHGYQFVDEFFVQHHFQRFVSNKYQHPQPFYFFFWVLPLMTLPWLPFFLASIWACARKWFRRTSAASRLPFSPSPLPLFAASWLLVPLVFFSFSGSKLPGYILPALPGAVILTSIFIFCLIESSTKGGNFILVIATSTFVTTALLLVLTAPRFAEFESVRTLIHVANEHGYSSNRVLMLHTISHNAEFYAAGRLLRDTDGKQRRLSGVGEVLTEINAENGQPVLVLVPLEYLSQLTADEKLKTEVLKDNGELAIAAVSTR